MGRFKFDEYEKYAEQQAEERDAKVDYFSLKNNMDVASVRMLYRSADDIETHTVHTVTVNGKYLKVNCLRSDYNDSKDVCPLCMSGNNAQSRVYIPLLDVKENKVKVWERGRKFVSQNILGKCSRYPDIYKHIFEIERHGQAGSKDTTYEMFDMGVQEVAWENLPSIPKTPVAEKTYQELLNYVQTGAFNGNGQSNNAEPRSTQRPTEERYSGNTYGEQRQPQQEYQRRTPATRGDSF